MKTVSCSSLAIFLHLFVNWGSPAGMNVYPLGASARKESFFAVRERLTRELYGLYLDSRVF